MNKMLRLTAIALMVLSGLAAKAAEWVKPVPKGSELQSENVYYLYNTGYNKFMNEGEAWGTQAVVAEKGLAAKINTIGDGIYSITFLNTSKGENRQLFRTTTDSKMGQGVKGAFVDGNNKPFDNISWVFTAVDGGYTISLPSDNSNYADGEYLGCDTLHAGSVSPTYGVYWDITNANDYKWVLVTEEDYAAYFVAVDTYKAALDLAAEIAKAQEDGLDITKAQAVYDNTASTLEEITAAINGLYEQRSNKASVDNPVDVTGKIKNSTFDNNIDGWTSTTGAQSNRIATNQSGDFTPPYYENWNKTSVGVYGKMYQEVSGLSAGIYLLKAAVSAQNTDKALNEDGTYLFGNDIKVAVTTVEPAFHQLFVPVTNGTLELGLLMTDDNKNNWVGIDNVTLNYFGNEIKSYQHMATLFDGWDVELEGRTYCSSFATTVTEATSAIQNATTTEDAVANYVKAIEAVADARKNATAYELLAIKVDYAEYDSQLDYQPLNEYLFVCHQILDEVTSSTEEVLAAVEKLDALVEEGKRNQLEPGADATSLLKNSTFTESTAEQKWDGFGYWDITSSKNFESNGTPKYQSGVAEVWYNDFELSQTVTGLRNGVYKLSTKAFFRHPEKNGNPYQEFKDGNIDGYKVATLFANASEAAIQNIYEYHQSASISSGETTDADGYYSPNNMTAAAAYFAQGFYPVEVYGIVTNGTLKVGIHGKDANSWVVWTAMQLQYLGKDADIIEPILAQAVKDGQALVSEPQGKDVLAALNTAIANANTAIETNDGDKMFAAYTELTNAAEASKTSIQAYAKLVTVNQLLASTIDLYQSDANETVLAEAIALNQAVTTALTNGDYSNEEATNKIAEVQKAIVTLKASAASDANEVDMTDLIVNPNFENNSTEGWTIDNGTAKCGTQYDVFEGYSGNFDICQVIENVPAGTYKVSMSGFYRRGTSENANNAWVNDTTVIAAYLYANGNDKLNLANAVLVNDYTVNAGEGNWSKIIVDDVTYFYPAERRTTRDRFDSGDYLNELYTNVGEDGVLTIGVRNDNSLKDDWTTMSNFRLTYYGKDSQHAQETGIDNINGNSTESMETYTINGVRTNGLTKGVNIVKTTVNGKVSVRKVIIK